MEIDSEVRFGLELNNSLNNNGDNYIIQKSLYPYCYIDFCIINTQNLYCVYLEHKERKYKSGYTSYDSYFITKNKINNIKKFYGNCYLVFDFRKNCNDNPLEFYWIKYDEELFNTYEVCGKNIKVLHKDCNVGYKSLIKEITKYGNINLDKVDL